MSPFTPLVLAGSALSMGGAIYVLERPTTLLMFEWFRAIGCLDDVNQWRAESNWHDIPPWVIESLPQALWAFASVVIVCALWANGSRAWRAIWVSVACIFALAPETGQALRWVPGTFDIADLVAVVIAIAAGLAVALIDSRGGRNEHSHA